MHVVCPGCSTRYALPAHLLGSSGARVCCPTCWLTFLLDAHGALTTVLGREPSSGTNGAVHVPAIPPPVVAGALAAGDTTPAAVATFDDPPGTLAAAASAGRLFADHGPALLDRFEALERGEDTGATAAFRAALAAVTGVELTPPGPSD